MRKRESGPGFIALAIPAAAAFLIVASIVTQLFLGSPHALRLLAAALIAVACLGFLGALVTLRAILARGMEFDWSRIDDLLAQGGVEQRRLINRMRFTRLVTVVSGLAGIALYLASLFV